MRRTLGTVLLVLGFLAVSLAVLLRFQVAPKLIAAPNDRYGVATLTGPGASYLDLATGRTVGAPMMITATSRSVTEDSTDEIAVWDSFTAIQRVADKEVMSASEWRLAFDRRTAELETCCGAHVNGNAAVSQSGLGLMFPTNDRLEKKDYTRFDASTQRAWTAAFVGEETVDGIKTYKFHQKIEGAVLGAPSDVPAHLFGPGAKGSVSAERVLYSDVTLWVEPRSGATVDQVQKVDTRLRNVADGTEVSVLAGEFTFVDASRADLIEGAEESLSKIRLLKSTGPIALVVAGIALLAGGVLLRRTPGRHQAGGRSPEPERAPEPV